MQSVLPHWIIQHSTTLLRENQLEKNGGFVDGAKLIETPVVKSSYINGFGKHQCV